MDKALKKYAPLFVFPTFAAFLVGFVYPFFQGLYLSFCKFTTIKNAEFIGFGNYVKVFQDASFFDAFWFTVLFAIVSVLSINIIAFALALILTRDLRGCSVTRQSIFCAE